MKKLIILSLLLSGCATSPFAGIMSPPAEPRKLANYVQTEKQVPLKIGVTAEGDDVIAYATERTYSANSAETPERLNFVQKLGRWIGGLSIVAIAFIVGSLFICGGAPILWAVKKYFTLKNSFKKVVEGIDELSEQDAEAQEQLKLSLSRKMDISEKKLVSKLKTEI